MSTHPLRYISTSADRFKLFTLRCNAKELADKIDFVKSQDINVINIGMELASYIDKLANSRFLSIDVYDHTKKLLDEHKSKIDGVGNDVVAIYNLGILMEPSLDLNAVQLFKEFSKSISLIIIWDNQSENPDRLDWPTQKQTFFLDFSHVQLKKLQYAL